MGNELLLISYYWPPAGGIGVQRWLTMTYYLCEMGWNITVVKPQGADYPVVDEELVHKVHPNIKFIEIENREVRKIYTRFFSRTRKNSNVKADDIFFLSKKEITLKQKLALWIRSNIFIPDARVTWVRPVCKYLKKHLRKQSYDILITTGPPHSTHLIGLKLKHIFPELRWISDFRDPWTDIEYHQNLLLIRYASEKHQRLERQVLEKSDLTITVSPSWAERLKELGAAQVEVIINGYDEKDFVGKEKRISEKFVMVHAGSYGENRWITAFWQALEALIQENAAFREDFRLEFFGQTEGAVLERLKVSPIKEHIYIKGQLSHEEVVQEMLNACLLLLVINRVDGNSKGRMTGKIYEYIATGNPVLLLGPEDGDAYRLIKEEGLGYSCGYDETKEIKESILSAYYHWKSGGQKEKSEDIQRYSRREAARKMSEVLRGHRRYGL